MKLIIFERDWADEFSPFGFAIMDEAEFEVFKAYYSKPQTWYFGTNEGFDKEHGKILFEACKVKDISKEDADKLIQLFGIPNYAWDWTASKGLFPAKPDEEEPEDE